MKTITALLALSLCACSTMSKETYVERREFRYPKGTTPHLKDMYLRDTGDEEKKVQTAIVSPNVSQVQYVGEVNHPEPLQATSDIDFVTTGDIPQEKTLADVQSENNMLRALAMNKILRDMQ